MRNRACMATSRYGEVVTAAGQHANRADAVFAADALARLHRVANGLPCQLNNAATAALIAAAEG